MKRTATIFLQAVILTIGAGILVWLLWEPHGEGVNAQSGFFEVYLDPFIAYIYIASVPFFVAVYESVKFLGYVRRDQIFSQRSVRALRTIKYCALVLIGFAALSVLFMIGGDREDRPAGVFLRLLITFPSIVLAAAAAISERVLQNAVDIKSENDLTV